jgi:hypothetical protein
MKANADLLAIVSKASIYSGVATLPAWPLICGVARSRKNGMATVKLAKTTRGG